MWRRATTRRHHVGCNRLCNNGLLYQSNSLFSGQTPWHRAEKGFILSRFVDPANPANPVKDSVYSSRARWMRQQEGAFRAVSRNICLTLLSLSILYNTLGCRIASCAHPMFAIGIAHRQCEIFLIFQKFNPIPAPPPQTQAPKSHNNPRTRPPKNPQCGSLARSLPVCFSIKWQKVRVIFDCSCLSEWRAWLVLTWIITSSDVVAAVGWKDG